MPQVCSGCTYYDAEGDQQVCPDCGTQLQFTMLGRINSEPEPEESIEAAWMRPPDIEIETCELPLGVRLSQIGGAVTFFAFFKYYMHVIPLILYIAFGAVITRSEPHIAIMLVALIELIDNVVLAIIAGAIAGAYSVNWIPQGIGVGALLLVIPVLALLVFAPQLPLMVYLILCLVTTGTTVFGAYLGHVLMKPARIIHS